MSRIRAITFDLDNTLWDVEPALIRAEQAQSDWLHEHRPGTIEHLDHEAQWDYKKAVWKRHPELVHQISKMREQVLYEMQRDAGYGEAEARTGAREAFAVFLEQRHRVQLYEEALEVLEALAGQYRLGALTNGNADIYKTDAGEYFDFAFLAEDVNASKPAPDMFHAAVARAGVTAAEIAHVGDNPDHDVHGAREAGFHTVWMNGRSEAWPHELPRADVEINNLKELPDAVARLAVS